MTRRDFQMICRVLKATHAPARVVEALAAELRTTNPRFDHSRFLTSSGVA